jgi:squalene-associated FAD-dependent desaturase
LTRRVAVIGGGWAGLAAALTLVERGVLVTVFEAARRLGGRARRVTVEGAELDNGQHILIGAYTETLRLMRVVGADPDVLCARMPLELRMASGFRLRAARLPPPLHLLAGVIRASALTLHERLTAVHLIGGQRRRRYRLTHDEPVETWLTRHRQSQRLREALWRPLCTAALNTPITHASMQVFLNVLRDTIDGELGASDLLLPRADLGALFPEPAARFIAARGGEIRLGTSVRAIEPTLQSVRLDCASEEFSHVIIACAPQHARAILSKHSALGPLAAQLGRFQYEPIFTCYLQYPSAVSLPVPMLGFESALLQWAFDRGALSGHAGLIACVLSGSGAHESLSQQALAAALHNDLARWFPDLPAPIWSRVIAEKRATFSCRPGLERPANATPVESVLLAGDYTASDYPATLETAVRSGVAAAKLISVH